MKTYTYGSNNEKKSKFKTRLRGWFKRAPWFTWIFRVVAVGFLLVALIFIYYSFTLPDPNKLLTRSVPESTKILDREGNVLYEIHGEVKRTLVNLDQISDDLKNATIALEDKDFYTNSGISPRGLLRSIIIDIFSGKKEQGGSTITQQFIKNAVLSRDKSFSRKIKEIILSLEIDARFSKADILKLYLNEIPYGRNAYGIEAASQSYFSKSAKELTLAESAYLAAIPQAPTYYNPFGPNRDVLDGRQKHALGLMKAQGYINEEQYKIAINEKVKFNPLKSAITAPHFVLYVQDYLADKYGEKTLEEGGLKVYTTLDLNLQKIAEEAVKNGVEQTSKKYGAGNAALVAIDPKTGQILAMVGSKDYFGDPEPAGCHPGKDCVFEPNVNVALSERQPGSSFKPYAYVTAFKKDFGYAPASMLMDVTTNFGKFGSKDYIPHNYNGESFGPVSMRQALAGSLNVPAVKTLSLVGPDNVIQTVRDLGITSPLQNCGLSLVLGGCEVKLLDHTAGFAALANMGNRHKKTPILKIQDNTGNILEEYQDVSDQVIDPQAVYELISIMTDNNARSFIFGSNSPLAFPSKEVACKTGTTNNWHDGWTMCFTPSIAIGVWAGNNDGTLLKKGADGVFVAAPIVHKTLVEWLKDKPQEKFIEPEGIKHITVDAVSGLIPTEHTIDTKTEIFADYAVPKKYDNIHIIQKIDSDTGLPATELTPPEKTIFKQYTIFHSEKPDNPSWENPVIAWARSHGFEYPGGTGTEVPPENPGEGPSLDIIEPGDGATISQLPLKVTIVANSDSGIARVDLFLDGQFITSLTQDPFTALIDKNMPDGSHTLAVHAVDKNGKTKDTTSRITFAVNQPLTLIVPSKGKVNLPVPITAQSADLFDVTFYYQIKNEAKPIGPGVATITPDGYQYTYTWENPPNGKTLSIFAQTTTGLTSQKITVIIP